MIFGFLIFLHAKFKEYVKGKHPIDFALGKKGYFKAETFYWIELYEKF